MTGRIPAIEPSRGPNATAACALPTGVPEEERM
jgi:hypothetical protein